MSSGRSTVPISLSRGFTFREAGFFFGLCGVITLFYLFLLPPSITRGGDSGELIAASYRLGIAHPSGYPIWCQFSRIFAFLPFGEVAWRYNFFSAVCGALASSFLAFTLWLWAPQFGFEKREKWWGTAATALLFAGAFLAASQFLLAEVYALAALWMALLLFFGSKWHLQNDWRDAFTLAFLAGSAPLVHLSTVYLLPWIFALAIWKKSFSRPKIVALLAFFALGFAPVAYLPLRSAIFPTPPLTNLDFHVYFPLDWGHPTNFEALKNHLGAAQYRHFLVQNGALAQPLSQLPARLGDLLFFLLLQFLWATPLLIWGAIASFKVRRFGALLLLIAGGNLAVSLNYNVPDQSNFFFPTFCVVAIWMGLGWTAFFRWGQTRRFGYALPVLLLATVGVQWFGMAQGAGGKGQTRAANLAKHWATVAQNQARRDGKPGFVLLGSDDSLWAFWYAKYVLQMAPDVETPWGRRHNKRRERGLLAQDVAVLKKHGSVFLTQWDAGVARRFGLQMLDESGAICQLTDTFSPARFLKNSSGPTRILTAQLPLHPLWKNVNKPGIPHLLPGTLAAFQIEAVVENQWRNSAATVEIQAVSPDKETAWTQNSPLVLPLQKGTTQILWRGAFGVPIETRQGVYSLKARLVTGPHQTEWQSAGTLIVSNK